MKSRPTQFETRENTASSRQHASRTTVDMSPVTLMEVDGPSGRNEASSYLPRTARTLDLHPSDVGKTEQHHPNQGSLSPTLSRGGQGERRSSLMKQVLSHDRTEIHAPDRCDSEESPRDALGKALASGQRKAIAIQGADAERRHARGRWSVSPLWEAKILLGVLKHQGLAGKGLVEAFERWAPNIAGASRADMNITYREQTGREMSDNILIQQADKVVRYNRLPSEARAVRDALRNSANLPGSKGQACEEVTRYGKPLGTMSGSPTLYEGRVHVGTDRAAPLGSPSGTFAVPARRAHTLQTRAENATKKKEAQQRSKLRLPNHHDSNILLSTHEVANLTGFRPKTIRRWVSRKLLNYIRVGNRLRFRLAAVELFLGQREVRK